MPTGCQPCRFFRGSDPIQGEETGRKIDEKTKGIVEEQYSPLDLKGVFPSEHAKIKKGSHQVNQHFSFFKVGTPNKNHDMCFFGVGTKVGL